MSYFTSLRYITFADGQRGFAACHEYHHGATSPEVICAYIPHGGEKPHIHLYAKDHNLAGKGYELGEQIVLGELPGVDILDLKGWLLEYQRVNAKLRTHKLFAATQENLGEQICPGAKK